MATFALIAEGPTDQVVLDRMVEQMCSDFFPEGLEVNFLQPLRDATDAAAANFGGWEMVLEYCQVAFDDALGTNDFVVIHLDTDAAEHPNFGVPLTESGEDRDHAAIIEETCKVIAERIGDRAFEEAGDRIIFAISVHSIESWLLLCLFNRDEPKGSFDRLNSQLIRGNEKPLVKEIRRYRTLAKKIKAKDLKRIARLTGSLPTFLRDLEGLRAANHREAGRPAQ